MRFKNIAVLSGITISGIIASATFATSSASATELVTNGGFETGDFTGWTVNNASYTGVGSGYANSGNYYAYLGNVGGLGTLSQTLATTAGQQYQLSYFLASDGQTTNEFQTVVGGNVLSDLSNISYQPYTKYTFNFTATSSSTSLTLGERDDPGYLALDDVSVTSSSSAVPEPSTILGAVAGLGFLGGLKRKLSKKK